MEDERRKQEKKLQTEIQDLRDQLSKLQREDKKYEGML